MKFKAFSFRPAQPKRYRYRLIGVDSDWVYSKNRTVTYPNLPPNEYLFIVQFKGENKDWNEQYRTLQIIIHPPYWKTWWFITSITVLSILLIYFFFKIRVFTYNKDLVRELLRHMLKRLRKDDPSIRVYEGKNEVKILTREINYVKSDGNYIEIHHYKGKTVVRLKLSEFLKIVPDPIEYIQIRRSYIVRIDKIEQKGKKELVVDGKKIQIGSTFVDIVSQIDL